MLAGLREEGIEPLQLVWALSREVRQLSAIAHAMRNGQSAEQAMQSQGVWRNRQTIIGRAVSRSSTSKLDQLTRQIAFTDQLAKGMHQGNLWDELEQITLQLAGSILSAK